MKKIYFSVSLVLVIFLLILLVAPSVFAVNTKINIKTERNTDVVIRILDVSGQLLDPVNLVFEETTDSGGDVSVVFSSDVKLIKMSVSIRGDEETRTKYIRDTIPTGKKIYVDLTQDPIIPVITQLDTASASDASNNTTSSNQTGETALAGINVSLAINGTNESTEGNLTEANQIQSQGAGKITGNVIAGVKAAFASNTTYYIVGGVFILGVLAFVIFLIGKKSGSHNEKSDKSNYRVTKLSEIRSGRDYDKTFQDAERKIEEAKRELDELKSKKSKIEEAKRRLEQDKRDLARLERA